MRSTLIAVLVAIGLTSSPADASPIETDRSAKPLREVMWVGNNWAGTATVVGARSLRVLKTGINLIPDKDQELSDIHTNPARLALYLAIQQGPGEGHDQYVDDMFTTRDGRYLAVSRPSFGDVVWIDIAKATAGDLDSIVVEQSMDGYRTDHMALSPDGRRLLVSDSTERQVLEFSMVDETLADGSKVSMGQRLRRFISGETPHESNYTADAKRIFHASIGKVYTPGDNGLPILPIGPQDDELKGDRWFEIVKNHSFKVARRWDMGKELAESGFPGMSPAVRPMAVAPGERFIYFQVSYFHGYVEFDTRAKDVNRSRDYWVGNKHEPATGAVTGVFELPNRVPSMPLELYVNDSAHHGLSIDEEGKTLCVAGTMDDYAALVNRRTGRAKVFDPASTGHDYLKPYWTTEGPEGTCWISLSGSDAVAVLDTRTKTERAYLPVGDHPQRIRLGQLPTALIQSWRIATNVATD